jgi:adenylate kinase
MKIIIISGTPGTGKTSISKLISKKLDAKLISLNKLIISKNFVERYDEERETYVADFIKLNKYLKKLIKNTKKEDIEYCIIEGHLADIVPNKYIDLVIVLKCNTDI